MASPLSPMISILKGSLKGSTIRKGSLLDTAHDLTSKGGHLEYRLHELTFPPGTYRLNVIVHEGRNLHKSLWEKVTSMGMDNVLDPFVKLEVTRPAAHASNAAVQRTTSIDNDPNPRWEESFSFLVTQPKFSTGNHRRRHGGELVVTVWDANYGVDWTWSRPIGIPLDNLVAGEDYVRKTIIVRDKGEIDLSLQLVEPYFDLRFGPELHSREQVTVKRRKVKIAEALSTLLGRNVPLSNVPTISIVAAGGGLRAMVCMSGVAKALEETGLMGCVQYWSSLSGSTWYLSNLYSDPDGPDVHRCNAFLRSRIENSEAIFSFKRADIYLRLLYKKYTEGFTPSVVDIFSAMLGYLFEKDTELEERRKLSDQRKNVETAALPFPLYTAIRVHYYLAEKDYCEWVEFTPYEVSMYDYLVSQKIEDVVSSKHLGMVCHKRKEPNLHFLQGIWSSAFAGMIKVMSDYLTSSGNSAAFYDRFVLNTLMRAKSEQWRPFAAKIPNPLQGLTEKLVNNGESETPPAEEVFLFPERPISKDDIDGERKANNEAKYHGGSLTLPRNCPESARSDLMTKRCKSTEEARSRSPNPQQDPERRIQEVGFIDSDRQDDTQMRIIDAGFDFNLPLPAVLRPERHSDVLLVFDFSWFESQTENPFQELRSGQSWATARGYKFPTIPDDAFDPDNPKEYYIFEDVDDPQCPVVIFFPLCNVRRRHVNVKGQDESMADVDPYAPVYRTFNFSYTVEDFDRMSELWSFNTKLALADIKKVIEKQIAK